MLPLLTWQTEERRREAGRGVASSVTGQVFEKLIYYCIKNDFQLLASEQTCFQHIDNANKLAALCLLQEWVGKGVDREVPHKLLQALG